MEGDFSVQQVCHRIFVCVVDDFRSGAFAVGNIGRTTDILGIHDGLDEAGVHRVIDLLEVG